MRRSSKSFVDASAYSTVPFPLPCSVAHRRFAFGRSTWAAFLAIAAGWLTADAAIAAGIETWTGTTSANWNLAGNWTGTNLPPIAGDTLQFGTATTTALTNDYAAGTSFGGITFTTGASAYTLDGNAIALTGALTDNAAGVVETIDVAIAGTSASSLVFGADGSGGNSITLNNNDTIGAISIGSNNTGTTNVLKIGAGNTLNVTGAFSFTAPTTSTNAAMTITGVGSTLNLTTTTNASFGIGTDGASGETASVDMSGLSNLIYSTGATGTGNFRAGFNGKIAATLTLANNTNSITAATFSIGDSNGKNGNTSTLHLNGTTTINAGTVTFGASKGTGNVDFLGGSPTGSAASPALKIRGQNGTARPALNFGTGTSGSGGGNTTLSFNGHYIDILGATANLALHSGTGTGSNSATVSFDNGVIDVTTLNLANRSGTGGGSATATVNVGGSNATTATLTVGTGGINFAGNADTASGTSTGTLDIKTNGLVQTGKDFLKTTATGVANVVLEGGTLDMQSHAIGSAAIPFDAVTMPAVGQTATLANLGGTGIITNGNQTGGLLMNGAGTLILTGSSNFTGGTTVSNGTLRVNGTLAGSTDVNSIAGAASGTGTYGDVTLDGGILTPGSRTSTGTLRASTLTVNSGSLRVKFGGSNADQLNLSGTTALTNDQITIGQLSPVVSNSYLVLTSGGPLTGIVPGPLTTIGRTNYTIDSAAFAANSSQLLIDVTGNPANVKWTGADSANNPAQWNNSQTDANWIRTDSNSGDTTHFYDADNVTFNGTNTGPSDLFINGTVTPGSIAVTAGTYSFSGGNIAGTGALTVSGGATLTINTYDPNFSGAVNVTGGTLNAESSQALGTGPVTISGSSTVNLDVATVLTANPITLNGGTLNIKDATAMGTGPWVIGGGSFDNTSGFSMSLTGNQPITINGSFTFLGAADTSHDLDVGTGAVSLNAANPTITVAAGTLEIDGVISGSGKGFTKDGGGTLLLINDNTYSGGATVNAGTLQVNRKTSGKSPLGSGNVTINAGGTLVGGNGDAFGFSNGLSPAAIVINGGTVTDLTNSAYRLTLRDVQFTGGTLTSAPGATGDLNGNYSLFAGTVETNPATTTAVISAATVSLQNGSSTWTIAPGMVTGGPTPGVDLLISSTLANWHPTSTTTTVGSVTKLGLGVMALSGDNIYTGPTNVNAGTLRLITDESNNISLSSTINVAGSATLDVSQMTAVGGLTIANPQTLVNNGTVRGTVTVPFGAVATGSGTYGNVIVNGGTFTAGSQSAIGTVAAANLTISSGSLPIKFSGAAADQINLSGTSSITDSQIAINQLTLPTPGSYLVLTAGSPLTGITPGVLQSVGRISYSIDSAAFTANPNQVLIDVAGSAAALKWTGADSANNPAQWNNMQTDANWQRTDGGTNDPTHFYDEDSVVFDGTNVGPSNLQINSSVSPGSINVTAGTYRFDGTGSIDGSGSLTVGSGASLTITTQNTFSGGTTVSAGATLQVADPNIDAGGSGSLGSGPITVNGTLFYNRSDVVSLTNTLNGAGTIHQAGTGTLSLAAANNFSGNFTIDNGILQVGNAGAMDSSSPASVTFSSNVPAGTTFRLNGFSVSVSALNSDSANPGGATVDNGATTNATLTVNSNATNTFSGVLQNGGTGSLNLTVSGGGTLVLSGANTYTGLTLINGGSTVQTAVANNLVGLAGQVQFNNGTIHITGNPNDPTAIVYAAELKNKFTTSGNAGATGTFNIDAGVTFQTGGSAATQTTTTAALQTAGSGTAGSSFIKTGLGTMIIYGQNNQQDTSFKLQQGTIDLRSARGLGGQDSNAVRLDMTDGTTLILNNDPGFNNTTVTPPAGLTGTDFLTGLRSATSGGTINLVVDRLTPDVAISQAIGALQAAGAFTMNVTSGPNMTSGTAGLFLDQNPGQTGGGFNGAVTLSGDGTFNVVNNATTGVAMQMTVNGVVTGGFGVNKTGTGTLTLNSASAYTGTTRVSNGTLRTASAGTIGAGPLVINAADTVNSTVSLATSQSVQSLTAATTGSGTGRVDVAAGVTLTVPVAGATSLQGNFTKSGDGTLVVNGSTALASSTAVNVTGGTLRINASGGAAVGTGVTAAVSAAATLELDGSISSLTDGTTPINRASINNSGALNVGNTVVAATTTQQVGGIDGIGTTQVNSAASLTADHIVQSALVIGGDATNAALVTIAASGTSGNPMAQGGGLALAGSMGSGAPLGPASTNLLTSGGSPLGGIDSLSGAGALGGSLGSINLGGTAAVPEPATILLVSLGAIGCLLARIRRANGR